MRPCQGTSCCLTRRSPVRGRRRPVHATQVVTDLVGAQRSEVFARATDRTRLGGAVGVGAGAAGKWWDVVDPWQHGDLDGTGRPGDGRRQSEGIGDLDGHRPDRDDAPLCRGQPVGDRGRAPHGDGREQQVGTGGVGDGVEQAEHGGGPAAAVAHRDLDGARVADVHPVGSHRPHHRDVELAHGHPHGAGDDQQSDRRPDGVQLGEAEDAARAPRAPRRRARPACRPGSAAPLRPSGDGERARCRARRPPPGWG